MRFDLLMSLRHAAVPVLLVTMLGSGSIGLPTGAHAHDEKDPRHMAMESLSKNMETLAKAIREAPPGSPEHALASQIVDVAKRMPSLFETPNAGHNNNRAKPEIWSDWTGFSVKIEEFQGATIELAAALKSADPAAWSAALQAVGQSCASCHRPYRAPRR